ncbi:MAG: hypothetical protein GX070_06130 [Alcaligenaceae bacterium]|uniref:Glycine zipper domain-containing protein n=1 Tax=Advenella mandrilli TaxID=2800330 RepID=A0ABS1EHT0_9BURK|nr:hypothetical protein [Advenella mandrilli]MBK1782584.1 hypothetical protein [Advenella mandrilli]NLY64520.1 hypothetical protein [Alcaligenaceae bacterium]
MSESFAMPPSAGIKHSIVLCPQCGSPQIQLKQTGKKLGGAIGTFAGMLGALSSASKGATVGAVVALRTLHPANPLNSITAAVLGALAGGAVGCTTGATLGQLIDETVLNNYLCLHCGHTFSNS